MADDIVVRLGSAYACFGDPLHHEARDEIERLRAVLREISQITAQGDNADDTHTIAWAANTACNALLSPAVQEAPAMRIWFDTEFIEDGKTIDLISIGLIREDGATYYAEIAECDHDRASPWVRENVLPHLTGPSIQRIDVARDIVEFVGLNPEFWAYYASYDWVALCQLFGTMTDLPKGWPMFCRDLKQVAASMSPEPKLLEQTSTEHNALADAEWTRAAHLDLIARAALKQD